jgi:autotransporter-associated beta strand protein
MANFANQVTLFTGSTITGGLNMSANAATTLTLDGAGTQGYSAAVTGATTFAGNLVKQGTGTWTLDQTFSYSGGTSVNGGKLIAGVKGALPSSAVSIGTAGTLQLATGTGTTTITSLSISTSGVLDIGNNTVNIPYTGNSPEATIAGYLKTGYNGGLWTGTGINSSIAAAGSANGTLSVGYADGNADTGTAAGPNQVLVKYTLAGDANLDGLVNFNDLVAVVQSFNKSGTDWAHGNFVYGASTTFNDLVAVVQNFNKTLTPAGSSAVSDGGGTSPISPNAVIDPTISQLPDPAGFSLAAIASSGLLLRRRRKSSV